MAKPKGKQGKVATNKKGGPSSKQNPNFKAKNKKGGAGFGGKGKQFKKKSQLKGSKEFNKKDTDTKKAPVEDKKRKIEADTVEQIKKKKKEKSEIVTKMMGIYEKLRRKDVTAEEKTKLIDEAVIVAEGKENEVVFKHSTVRVLEMCVKYGKNEQREKIFKIFKDNLVTLLTSKYAKFLVEKFIEYGSKEQRKKIVESFYGKVKKLIKDKRAGSILEEIYCKYANASQRAALVEEFYGPEFAVFKVASGRTLEDILENDPDKKEKIMKHMKESLTLLCQKDVLGLSVVHRALLDFFKYANTTQKSEIVEILKTNLVHVLHTKDGSKVAMNCIWLASTKDRKAITKSFKTFVMKICKEEFGHKVMFSLFDVMDDTVLLKKALFPEILINIEELMVDQYGRKVLLYILKPRNNSNFLPEVQKLLEQADDNKYSKKDSSVRQGELRDILLPNLLACLTQNAKDIMLNKSTVVVFLAALEVSKDSKQTTMLMEKVASIFAKPLKEKTDLENESESEEEKEAEEGDVQKEEKGPKADHPVVDACGHWCLKSVIKQDKKRQENGYGTLFSTILCNHVTEGGFSDWATENRGAFVLVSLLESGIQSVTDRVKADLKFVEKDKLDKELKGIELLLKLIG
eukprot:TCONS_00027031-protein